MSLNKYRLDGKVALVTGGSRGIGRACALAFAEAGADVVISGRKEPDLMEVAKEIQANGGKCLAVTAHIAKVEESKNLVEQAKAEFSKIDILVNNAGTNPYFGPLMDAEEWAWDTTMNVNLKGPFLLSQLVARMMKEQGGGNIINMSSTSGRSAGELSIYGVTKAGLIMLTECMAKEWGQFNIRVNAVAPGTIKTRFSEVFWKDADAEASIKKNSALGRIGEVDDVASVVIFLASDASRYITGETVVIDGGQLLGGPSFPAEGE